MKFTNKDHSPTCWWSAEVMWKAFPCHNIFIHFSNFSWPAVFMLFSQPLDGWAVKYSPTSTYSMTANCQNIYDQPQEQMTCYYQLWSLLICLSPPEYVRQILIDIYEKIFVVYQQESCKHSVFHSVCANNKSIVCWFWILLWRDKWQKQLMLLTLVLLCWH